MFLNHSRVNKCVEQKPECTQWDWVFSIEEEPIPNKTTRKKWIVFCVEASKSKTILFWAEAFFVVRPQTFSWDHLYHSQKSSLVQLMEEVSKTGWEIFRYFKVALKAIKQFLFIPCSRSRLSVSVRLPGKFSWRLCSTGVVDLCSVYRSHRFTSMKVRLRLFLVSSHLIALFFSSARLFVVFSEKWTYFSTEL